MKRPIQHRWRRVGTKAGKDSQMEEDKDSKDAAQYKRLRNKIELKNSMQTRKIQTNQNQAAQVPVLMINPTILVWEFFMKGNL